MEKKFIKKKKCITIICCMTIVLLFSLYIIVSGLLNSDERFIISGIVFCIVVDLGLFLPIFLLYYKQKLIINTDEFVIFFKTDSNFLLYNGQNTKGLVIKWEEVKGISFEKATADKRYVDDLIWIYVTLRKTGYFKFNIKDFIKSDQKLIYAILEEKAKR